MYNRILKLPLTGNHSIFLFGPRGTGKTTFLKQQVKDAIYLNLLDFSVYAPLLAAPNRLKEWIPLGTTQWIIIDEIQRIPALLDEVHRLIEECGYRFILTGSSARALKRRGVNLLAGRALKFHMHPLVPEELKQDFQLTQALRTGLLPTVFTTQEVEKYLKTYVETYLREEVLQEGLTRNVSSFSRFLEMASFSQGCVINMSAIAREVGIDRQVVANYFSITDDLLLSYRLDPFTKRAKRKIVQHQKFYFFDAGVYQFLRPRGPLDTPSEIGGAALETLFLQIIKALNDYYEWEFKIYFWRTMQRQEIDFVLYGEKGIYAIEIKHSQQFSINDTKHLKVFHEEYPMAKLFLFYLGTEKRYDNNISILPFMEGIEMLTGLFESN